MKMKNDKMKLVIWAVVALVIGVVIGTFLIAPAVTGNAMKSAVGTQKITAEELTKCSANPDSCEYSNKGIITTDCGCNLGGHYYSCGNGCSPTAYCNSCETHKFLWGAFQIS